MLTMKLVKSQTYTETVQSLLKLGFRRSSIGDYTFDNIRIKMDSSWMTIEKSLLQKSDVDPLQDQLSYPGLWKYVSEDDILKIRFDLPLSILNFSKENDSDKTLTSVFEATLTWAISTSDRRLNSWSVASLENTTLSKKEEFIVQHDQFIRRGYLVCEDHVLALRIPISDHVPAELEIIRRNWLHAILLEAQNRLRMVRFRQLLQGGPIEAEIDLSGTPSVLVESLMRIGFDVLSECVKWLIASVDVLTSQKLETNIFRVCKI